MKKLLASAALALTLPTAAMAHDCHCVMYGEFGECQRWICEAGPSISGSDFISPEQDKGEISFSADAADEMEAPAAE